jgi:fused signal recognition particle receptor
MFGSLKEKLKKWVSKNKEEDIVETPKKEKKTKKEGKKKAVKKEKKTKDEQLVIEDTAIQEEISPTDLEEKEEKTKKKRPSFFRKELTEEKFGEMFEELEMILLQNNVAYAAVEKIKESLEKKLIGESLKNVDLAKELKESIKSILINPPNFLEEVKKKSPFVIVFSGINGSGKTTTIAKVANYLQKNKLSVCVAAADTFRAAAIQQLEEHANRLKVPIVKKDYGADPASVGFDAISYAKKNKIDVVLIDTAGRMQNKDSLMQEMEKIVRVNNPDMKIFLGESITGNDATEQAKTFNEAIDITGMILSKADVDEKGGTAISVSQVTGKPILFLGTGQEYKDLEIFDKDKLIEKLGL